MKALIRQWASDLGFDACGFTSAAPPDGSREFDAWLQDGRHGQMEYLARNRHKRVDPQQVLPGAQSIIALAVSYADKSDSPRPARNSATGGRVARYACFDDYHDVIAERLKLLTARLSEHLGPNERSLWYVDTGPILERDMAQRAGVGFIGKHTNLISRELGNWFFLCEIITTHRLEPDHAERNRCGSCTRCLSACPTGAITAPFQLDARRCISYLTIELKGSIPNDLRPAIGNRIYGCDDCLEACPWNRFAKESRLMQPYRRVDLRAPELLELLALDQNAFKQKFAGTPILRTKRRGLLRNVCVALGNIGNAAHMPALKAAAQDPEPLIAEHARWAVAQIETRSSGSAKESRGS